MKKILKYCLVLLLMIVMFCILLTLVSVIPKSAIEEKTKESAKILAKETNIVLLDIPLKSLILLDNYSDALMINTAYSIDTKQPFYSAMVDRKNYIDGKTEKIFPDTSGELKSSSKYKNANQVGDLIDTVNGETIESFEYARYWHGYLVVLRILLMFLNISQIRILLQVILYVLSAVLLYLIYKKINLSTSIIFLLGMIICDYFYIGFSLISTPVFLISIISSIILLLNKVKNYNMFFMIIGGLTCFVDLLTAPIIALGIPLILYICIKTKEEFNKKEIYINILKLCIMWGIGYFGIWISKWLIVDIIYKKGLINCVIEQLKYRTISSNTQNYNIIDIFKVLNKIVRVPLILSIITTFILVLIKMIKSHTKIININIKKVLPYIITFILPIAWYLVLANHSYLHLYKFTYRNIFVISISLMLIIYNIFEKSNNDKGGKISKIAN